MVPIMLDGAALRAAIVGEGEDALRRLWFLRHHGAAPVAVFAPAPSEALAVEAGPVLQRHWPEMADLDGLHLVLAGDLDVQQAESLAGMTRETGTLLNIEDRPTLSDFHIPATVRRGALLLTVSTGGRAPGLSRRLARWLAKAFGPEWEARLGEIAHSRTQFRAAGITGSALAERMDLLIDEKGWLS